MSGARPSMRPSSRLDKAMPSQLQVKKTLAQRRKSLPHRMEKMAANIQLQARIRREMDKQLRRAELAHIQHQLTGLVNPELIRARHEQLLEAVGSGA